MIRHQKILYETNFNFRERDRQVYHVTCFSVYEIIFGHMVLKPIMQYFPLRFSLCPGRVFRDFNIDPLRSSKWISSEIMVA